MRTRLFAALIVWCLFAVGQRAESYQATQKPPAQGAAATSASLQGRVVAAETGRPIRSAAIIVEGDNGRHEALTDEYGRFDVQVSPGQYLLIARKTGYLESALGQTELGGPGRRVQVSAGGQQERFNFVLLRGAVILGTAIDDVGEALIGAVATALKIQYLDGERQLVPSSSVQTNDLGQFRLSGLASGEYFVSIAVPSAFGEVGQSQLSFPRTYFPATTDLERAVPVRVEPADSASVLVEVPLVRSARLRGIVTDTDGTPWQSGFVNLTEIAGLASLGVASGAIDGDGGFAISAVPPGRYSVRADDFGGRSQDGFPRMALVDTIVNGSDLDLVLRQVPWGKLTGRIAVDEDSRGVLALESVKLDAIRTDRRQSLQGLGGARIAVDGKFELSAPEGHMLLRSKLPEQWFIKSIRHRGIEVIDSGIELTAARPVSELEIELSDQSAVVAGSVTNDRLQPLHGVSVVIFPRQAELRSWPSRHIFVARSDPGGEFALVGVPPGEYAVVALPVLEPGRERELGLLDELDSLAQTIVLRSGERATIRLLSKQ